MLLIKAHELSPLPSPFLSFPAILPLLRMQLPRNPWVTLRKGVSSLVDANNAAEKNNKWRTICLMKSLTFYFISPYCILKEVNRKTFANYTTVYWLLGRLLSYLSEELAVVVQSQLQHSALGKKSTTGVTGAQLDFWVLHLWTVHKRVEMCCFTAGWKPGKGTLDLLVWGNLLS